MHDGQLSQLDWKKNRLVRKPENSQNQQNSPTVQRWCWLELDYWRGSWRKLGKSREIGPSRPRTWGILWSLQALDQAYNNWQVYWESFFSPKLAAPRHIQKPSVFSPAHHSDKQDFRITHRIEPWCPQNLEPRTWRKSECWNGSHLRDLIDLTAHVNHEAEQFEEAQPKRKHPDPSDSFWPHATIDHPKAKSLSAFDREQRRPFTWASLLPQHLRRVGRIAFPRLLHPPSQRKQLKAEGAFAPRQHGCPQLHQGPGNGREIARTN